MKEIAIMKKLNHPNIVRLHEVIDDQEQDLLFMILDYAEKG
jgi:[calcium/calmodulin-dependent protein kinase] kinase